MKRQDNSGMRRYKLRDVVPADESVLTDLFEEVFGKVRSSAEWRWKFSESRALASDFVPVDSMVALDEGGAIVAHAGALTLPGRYRGRSIPFVQICDVMVHPAHRGGLGQRNLFTLLLRRLLSKIAVELPAAFSYGFPGRRPYLIGERSRVYSAMEVAVQSDLSGSPRFPGLWRVVPLAWDDERIDGIWMGLRDSLTLSLVRDRAYLRWRYAENPEQEYQLWGLSRFGRLRGWVVCSALGDGWRVVDLLLPKSALLGAMNALRRHLELWREGRSLSLWLPRGWRSLLRAPMVETPVVAASMSASVSWDGAIETPFAREHLYYTMGDVDIF